MSYHPIKDWNNRKETRTKRLLTVKGRTWTRRIQWLEDMIGMPVKLKFDDGEIYEEHGVLYAFAQIVYDRFIQGASIKDAISVYGENVQGSRKSEK